MANVLSRERQLLVRELLLQAKSIKATARQSGTSRNSVRKIARARGPFPWIQHPHLCDLCGGGRCFLGHIPSPKKRSE